MRAGGGVAGAPWQGRPAGEEGPINSTGLPPMQPSRRALADVVAEALAQGLLISGGTYRLAGGLLRPEGGR